MMGAGIPMADHLNKKKDQSGIAENPIAEVFEGRHPAESEKRWAETTLAKTLEKAPEKPPVRASQPPWQSIAAPNYDTPRSKSWCAPRTSGPSETDSGS
jgi:hypothetical protein